MKILTLEGGGIGKYPNPYLIYIVYNTFLILSSILYEKIWTLKIWKSNIDKKRKIYYYIYVIRKEIHIWQL